MQNNENDKILVEFDRKSWEKTLSAYKVYFKQLEKVRDYKKKHSTTIKHGKTRNRAIINYRVINDSETNKEYVSEDKNEDKDFKTGRLMSDKLTLVRPDDLNNLQGIKSY